ncbi:hypothetical protein K2173_021789 [Erythroxylum novogranatense]|uniref:Beta-glucosidase n=1 Tax=Erythroxylum novogranatense TaxID=1862640 RepID=A0AAV8TXW9_9ROSI|nr:hypothetical protein K2173_021789 [Erythroxylum novogranatense]
MAIQTSSIFLLLFSLVVAPSYGAGSFKRTDFPEGFVFGTASSSYQYEGAVNEGGKGPTSWDNFTRRYPGRCCSDENMGLDAFRFSISWARILPKGKASGGVNKEGIQFYNNLINELLANGIKPFVALFHWDLPQALEDEYGGFLNAKIVEDFRNYSDICFKEFGDRVKNWLTINEPTTFTLQGYATGVQAPGRCTPLPPRTANCTEGDSGTEPYIVGHNILLAHAAAVKLYREQYQKTQQGQIALTLVSDWFVPKTDSEADKIAAERMVNFTLGWFLEPLTFGDYPGTMKSLVGERLPKFTEEQSNMVKGSFDFLGMNYYTAMFAADNPTNYSKSSYLTDSRVEISFDRNGEPIGRQAGSFWLHYYPTGLKNLLLHAKKYYSPSTIYITENGVDEINNTTLPLEQQLADEWRIDYHFSHLTSVQEAIKEGVNVKGYFAWTLLDVFEWASGFTVRFGINYVDFNGGFKRIPKQSARWFQTMLKG